MAVVYSTKAVQKMEGKKERGASHTSSISGKNVVNFVGEVKQEFHKIEWTTKSELKTHTKIVLASIFLCGMSVYVIDLVIQGLLGGMNLLIKLFTG